jgi:peptidoglycan/xylan/chitin deacetylase (PgdA/CDA1 family)
MKIRLVVTFAILLSMSLFEYAFADQSQPLLCVDTQEKVIALTFDDGPDEQMLVLAKLLASQDCHATFFVIGKNMEKYAEVVREASELGHEIGNHSYTHPKLPNLATLKAVEEEIAKTQAVVKQTTGTAPVLFRAPFLQYDEKVWDVLDRLGLQAVGSNAGTRDWNKETTAEQIIERATGNLKPGTIVLMHTFPENTFKAIPKILRILKEKGYRCITVSEMLKLQP